MFHHFKCCHRCIGRTGNLFKATGKQIVAVFVRPIEIETGVAHKARHKPVATGHIEVSSMPAKQKKQECSKSP